MYDYIQSNEAIINNINAIKDLLDDYSLGMAEFAIKKNGNYATLQLLLEDGACFMGAVGMGQLPQQEDFPDESSWFDAEIEAFLQYGDDGFINLLGDLSPYLETPLTILSLDAECGATAQMWCVLPGATEVETLSICA